MEVLQWIFISGLSLAIITLIFTLYYFCVFVFLQKKTKELPTKKSRSKGLRKRQAQARELLFKKRKKTLRNFVISLVTSIGFFAGAFYVTYYQSTNLSKEDSQSLTDSYYYVRDLQQELQKIENGQTNVAESKQAITYIATSLASYSIRTASTLNTVEGQSVLNRYYSSLAELGINVSKQLAQMYEDPTIASEILTDFDKVKRYQKKAIDFYKINESLLEAQK